MRTYKTRASMDSEVQGMARRGYRVVAQSGQFATNVWTTSVFSRPKVTVTFEKVPPAPAPEAPSPAMGEDAAIALLTKLGYTVRPPGRT